MAFPSSPPQNMRRAEAGELNPTSEAAKLCENLLAVMGQMPGDAVLVDPLLDISKKKQQKKNRSPTYCGPPCATTVAAPGLTTPTTPKTPDSYALTPGAGGGALSAATVSYAFSPSRGASMQQDAQRRRAAIMSQTGIPQSHVHFSLEDERHMIEHQNDTHYSLGSPALFSSRQPPPPPSPHCVPFTTLKGSGAPHVHFQELQPPSPSFESIPLPPPTSPGTPQQQRVSSPPGVKSGSGESGDSREGQSPVFYQLPSSINLDGPGNRNASTPSPPPPPHTTAVYSPPSQQQMQQLQQHNARQQQPNVAFDLSPSRLSAALLEPVVPSRRSPLGTQDVSQAIEDGRDHLVDTMQATITRLGQIVDQQEHSLNQAQHQAKDWAVERQQLNLDLAAVRAQAAHDVASVTAQARHEVALVDQEKLDLQQQVAQRDMQLAQKDAQIGQLHEAVAGLQEQLSRYEARHSDHQAEARRVELEKEEVVKKEILGHVVAEQREAFVRSQYSGIEDEILKERNESQRLRKQHTKLVTLLAAQQKETRKWQIEAEAAKETVKLCEARLKAVNYFVHESLTPFVHTAVPFSNGSSSNGSPARQDGETGASVVGPSQIMQSSPGHSP